MISQTFTLHIKNLSITEQTTEGIAGHVIGILYKTSCKLTSIIYLCEDILFHKDSGRVKELSFW